MLQALTAEQSRDVEAAAVARTDVTLGELMRSAGRAIASEVLERMPAGRIVVLAGPGNNGGDGWVAARLLRSEGRDVSVWAVRAPEELAGEAALAASEAIEAGVAWHTPDGARMPTLEDAAVIIDALLGTGSALPLSGAIVAWCEAIEASGALVLSVDLPTGVDADTGRADRHAVRADVTVTFSALKRGLVLHPGAGHAGEIVVADIGIPDDLLAVAGATEVWTNDDFARVLPLPAPDAHKNTRGRVLVIAGSGRYPGAAILAARGAMRAGAGYVTLAVPEPVVRVAQTHLQAAPIVGLPSARTRAFSANAAAAALELAADYDAVVLGPGLTLADGAVVTARALVSQLNKPLVIDADALNALVDAGGLLQARKAATVITPHPGELARMLGIPLAAIQSDRASASAMLAGKRCAVVLKGAGTVVSGLGRQAIITAGTPALATAGTGDVLAGVIGTFLAQGLDPFTAGVLGAQVHARAGEAAAARLTPVCVTAEDVPEHLPDAFGELLGSW